MADELRHHHQLQSQALLRAEQENRAEMAKFWADATDSIATMPDFQKHELPLARIKKIMKSDEDVKMISAEAPVVFAKACELFIMELTKRAWQNTKENKRRTLQKVDIAQAIARCDMYDFLIDIVPREDLKPHRGKLNGQVMIQPVQDDVQRVPAPIHGDMQHFYYPDMYGAHSMRDPHMQMGQAQEHHHMHAREHDGHPSYDALRMIGAAGALDGQQGGGGSSQDQQDDQQQHRGGQRDQQGHGEDREGSPQGRQGDGTLPHHIASMAPSLLMYQQQQQMYLQQQQLMQRYQVMASQQGGSEEEGRRQ